jgi:hypothetical protein
LRRRKVEEASLGCELERTVCASRGKLWDDAMDLGPHGVAPVRLELCLGLDVIIGSFVIGDKYM